MEQKIQTWVEHALRLCVSAARQDNKLIKEDFTELAEEFLSFLPYEKQAVFEFMENTLQDSRVIICIYSCIIQYTDLREFEKSIMKHILSCDYETLPGCMIELQVIRYIKGCYTEKRILHRRNAEKLRQSLGQEWTYIPVKSRNPNRIAIVTEQILSLLHAPTAIVFNMAYILKKYMNYEVFIFVCPCDYKISPDMWCRPIYNCSMDTVPDTLIDMKYKDEIFQGYQINMDAPDCIQKYSMMLSTIEEWNPLFVLGLGMVNPVLDLINQFTTVAAMAMTANCPISDSEILFRLTRQEEEIEQEYTAALSQNQSWIFMEKNLPVIVEGQTGVKHSREELGLPSDKFIIVIVGNRLDEEIDAKFTELMESVLSENPDSIFAIIGPVTELRGYFKEKEYQDRIFYLGYCSDLLGVYGVMDLYLNPQRAGGGWSSAMALMAGVPVVTLPDCDVAYNTGERFVVSGYPEMKAEIHRYMADQHFMESMKKYATECGTKNTEEKMIKYVQSMMDGIITVLEGKNDSL